MAIAMPPVLCTLKAFPMDGRECTHMMGVGSRTIGNKEVLKKGRIICR